MAEVSEIGMMGYWRDLNEGYRQNGCMIISLPFRRLSDADEGGLDQNIARVRCFGCWSFKRGDILL